MNRDKKGIGRNLLFLVKASVCLLAMAFWLAGCGVFGGGKAEVKVDFGQYGDTGKNTSAAGNESTENSGQSGTEGTPNDWPGKEDEEESQSGTEGQPDSAGTAGSETAVNDGETNGDAAVLLEAPKEHRDEFNKSEFAAELLAYLAANGRGEEAFSEPIFDSEKKVYSKEELEKLSDVMCKIFRNEIYARHGMIFGDEDLNQLYGAFSWYKGTIGLREFEAQAELPFNETEYANISNVVAVEKARREQNGN